MEGFAEGVGTGVGQGAGRCGRPVRAGEAHRSREESYRRGLGKGCGWVVTPGVVRGTRAKAAAEGWAESIGDLEAPHGDGDAGADLEELEPERFRRWRGPSLVPCSARRRASKRMEAKAEKRSRSWLAAKRVADVRSEKRSSCCSLITFSMLPLGQ